MLVITAIIMLMSSWFDSSIRWVALEELSSNPPNEIVPPIIVTGSFYSSPEEIIPEIQDLEKTVL